MADGNSCKNVININLQIDDLHILESFKKALESDSPIRIVRNVKYKYKGKIYPAKDKAVFNICNGKFRSSLEKWGIVPRKTDKIIIPNIDKILIRHFIRGFFDGDGSISSLKNRKTYRFEFCCKHEKFMYELLNTVSNQSGIFLKIYRPKNRISRIYTSSHLSIMKMFIYLYRNSNIFLYRKYNKFIELKNYLKNNKRFKRFLSILPAHEW